MHRLKKGTVPEIFFISHSLLKSCISCFNLWDKKKRKLHWGITHF